MASLPPVISICVGVDDDDVVAGVHVGREDRLVLAAQDGGDLRGQAAEDLAAGIDHVPAAHDVLGLRRVGLHTWEIGRASRPMGNATCGNATPSKLATLHGRSLVHGRVPYDTRSSVRPRAGAGCGRSRQRFRASSMARTSAARACPRPPAPAFRRSSGPSGAGTRWRGTAASAAPSRARPRAAGGREPSASPAGMPAEGREVVLPHQVPGRRAHRPDRQRRRRGARRTAR